VSTKRSRVYGSAIGRALITDAAHGIFFEQADAALFEPREHVAPDVGVQRTGSYRC
jgi:hypothetical protein